MIVLVLTAIGVATALFTVERLRRIAALPLRHLWLVWLAIVVQTVLFQVVGSSIALWLSNVIHLGTYALCVAFLWVNRQLPGMVIIAIGTSMNLVVITANGGTMPASPEAWERAGLAEIPAEVFKNSRELSSPRLLFLGDIFAVPANWPLSNVFSIGDVLVVVGGTYLAHRWCSVPTERFELSLTAT